MVTINFNKDYIGYTADTVRNTYNVDLTQHLQMYKAHANDSARAHRQYGSIRLIFITDYDVLLVLGNEQCGHQ